MGIFGLGKKRGIIDLSKNYTPKPELTSYIPTPTPSASNSTTKENPIVPFAFFGAPSTPAPSTEETTYGSTENADEKRRKLAKRLMDMTNKIEDLSNQIYHLQQRLEVLERKSNLNEF